DLRFSVNAIKGNRGVLEARVLRDGRHITTIPLPSGQGFQIRGRGPAVDFIRDAALRDPATLEGASRSAATFSLMRANGGRLLVSCKTGAGDTIDGGMISDALTRESINHIVAQFRYHAEDAYKAGAGDAEVKYYKDILKIGR